MTHSFLRKTLSLYLVLIVSRLNISTDDGVLNLYYYFCDYNLSSMPRSTSCSLMFRSFTKTYHVFLVFHDELAQSILMVRLTPSPGNHFPLSNLYCCYPVPIVPTSLTPSMVCIGISSLSGLAFGFRLRKGMNIPYFEPICPSLSHTLPSAEST